MDDKITQLWELAAQRDDIWTTRHQRFAELIIQECTTVINEIPRYAKTTNLKGYENACIADSIRAIEEHFGVE